MLGFRDAKRSLAEFRGISESSTVRDDSDPLWSGERGYGGISWADRSRMGPLRGVIDEGDTGGRRNLYLHALHTRVIRREIRRVRPLKRALDFGCGTGRFLKLLAAYCPEVHAIDREPAMVEAAQHYVHDIGGRIECWKSERIPFPSEFFDFILSCTVLGFTTPNLFDDSLRELARVAHPGAELLMIEPVSKARGLTRERYLNAMSRAGFTCSRMYPILVGPSRRATALAQHTWIPLACFPAIAALDLAFTTSRRYAIDQDAGYVQYAIIAHRASETG
jgi:SAM-dependent methyltransferase